MTKQQLIALSKITPGPWAVPVANVFRVIAPEAEHLNKPEGMGQPYPWAIVADLDTDSIGGKQAANDAIAIAALPDLLSERAEMIHKLKQYIELIPDADAIALIKRAEGSE